MEETDGNELLKKSSIEAPLVKTALNHMITSPLIGKIVPLQDVQYDVFSSGALGKGIAIEPTIGELHAPADGQITTLFPTKHAVGLTTEDGIEILMHIGMDTVELNGNGFTVHTQRGNKVRKGTIPCINKR